MEIPFTFSLETMWKQETSRTLKSPTMLILGVKLGVPGLLAQMKP